MVRRLTLQWCVDGLVSLTSRSLFSSRDCSYPEPTAMVEMLVKLSDDGPSVAYWCVAIWTADWYEDLDLLSALKICRTVNSIFVAEFHTKSANLLNSGVFTKLIPVTCPHTLGLKILLVFLDQEFRSDWLRSAFYFSHSFANPCHTMSHHVTPCHTISHHILNNNITTFYSYETILTFKSNNI